MSFVARRAFATPRAFTTSARRFVVKDKELASKQKANPELMILGVIMVAALGGAGWYFGTTPGQDNAEASVKNAGMPWETGSGEGKYKYHPGGDANAATKDAPSALNASIIPNVTLPKYLHDSFNKFGKD
ncbi:hypothetical protein MKZ38_003487 [Zalerion maritima]|uniref:Uncharacterized protein n=1 Tax=Zalerion maritima TaxID=339359 RepID=A0AAD5WX38_9PEZI|nr:hypothetical protein MKZ38_003487 [Zalerion maritima]